MSGKEVYEITIEKKSRTGCGWVFLVLLFLFLLAHKR
jgi:hypothetical protein